VFERKELSTLFQVVVFFLVLKRLQIRVF